MPLASLGMDAVASSARYRDVEYERCVKKVIVRLKKLSGPVSLLTFSAGREKVKS